MCACLGLEGSNQLAGEVAVSEYGTAVDHARAQALVGGEAVLLDEGSGLIAQGGPGHAQEI